MDCAHFSKTIYLYESGELSRKDLAAFREHVQQCITCQKELEGYQHLVEVYRSLPAREGSGIHPNILLNRARQKRDARTYVVLHHRIFVPALAVVFMVCLALLFLFNSNMNESGFQQQSFVTIFDQPSTLKTRRKITHASLPLSTRIAKVRELDYLAEEITNLSHTRQRPIPTKPYKNQISQLQEKIEDLNRYGAPWTHTDLNTSFNTRMIL